MRARFAIVLLLLMAAPAAMAVQPVLVIHGGAGVVRSSLTPTEEAAARAALVRALEAGHRELAAGRPALDAVTPAITVLRMTPISTPARAPCSPTKARTSSMPRSWTG